MRGSSKGSVSDINICSRYPRAANIKGMAYTVVTVYVYLFMCAIAMEMGGEMI